MPAALYPENHCFQPREPLLSFEELTRIVRMASELGVNKIRLTGGKPLLRHNVDQLIAMLSALPGIENTALTRKFHKSGIFWAALGIKCL